MHYFEFCGYLCGPVSGQIHEKPLNAKKKNFRTDPDKRLMDSESRHRVLLRYTSRIRRAKTVSVSVMNRICAEIFQFMPKVIKKNSIFPNFNYCLFKKM